MRELTEQQALFVTHYTSGDGSTGNAAESARRAGYSVASARDIGSQLMGKPHVKAAVEAAHRAALSGELTTLAMAALRDILREGSTASEKNRLDAAKTVLDRAGLASRPADGRAASGVSGAGQFGGNAAAMEADAKDAAEDAAAEIRDIMARHRAERELELKAA